MKLAIFGATGKTGRHLVDQALAQGHEVTAFVRDPSKLDVQHDLLPVVQGDVKDVARVEEAVRGQDAVLLALGHRKSSSGDILSVGTSKILDAMQRHGVRRLVSITGAGVADPNDEPKLINKIISFLLKRMQPELLADSERQASMIRQSDLEWVIVRVPRLTDRERKGTIRTGYAGKGTGTMITRADAATFMLEQLTSDVYLHKAPMISN